MAKKTKQAGIFQVRSSLATESDTRPDVDTTDPNNYCGYFENEHHEQFLFTYDYETRKGNIWLSKNGWQDLTEVNNGKAQKAKLGHSEKAWLKACWNAVMAEEQRRERSKKLREPNAFQDKPVALALPPHDEIIARMGNLYDALIQINAAPDCSKTEFTYGWTGFIELIARIEAKYKDRMATGNDTPLQSHNEA